MDKIKEPPYTLAILKDNTYYCIADARRVKNAYKAAKQLSIEWGKDVTILHTGTTIVENVYIFNQKRFQYGEDRGATNKKTGDVQSSELYFYPR